MTENKFIQFFCEPVDVDRTAEILSQLGAQEVGIGARPIELFAFDEQGNIRSSGVKHEIRGFVAPETVEDLVTTLSSKGIAGYSRETRVFVFDPSAPTETDS